MENAQILSEEYSKALLPNTIIQLIVGTLGVFGNLLVLLMYTKYVEDRTGSRYFIPVLAVVDLAGLVSSVSYFHVSDTMHFTFPGVILCKMMPFSVILTGGLSAHFVFAIALQRYVMICRPFGQKMTKNVCRVVILIMVLISIGYTFQMLKFSGISNSRSVNATGNLTICVSNDGTENVSGLVLYLGILLFISFINICMTAVLYIPVIKTVYNRLSHSRQNRNKNIQDSRNDMASIEKKMSGVGDNTISKHSESNNTSKIERSSEEKARKNITVMFLVIIIVYVVSCMTSLVTQILSFVSKEESKGYVRNIRVLCLRFNLLNHIANPYIYWFYDIKFRNELRRFCCNKILGKNLFHI